MPPDELPPDDPLSGLGKAFVRFLKWLVALVVETAAKHAQRDESARYYDRRSFPGGVTEFDRLTRDGVIPSYRIGKRILVLRSEAHAHIEARSGAKPRAPKVPTSASPPVPEKLTTAMILQDMMEGEGVKPRGKASRGTNGPATRRSR